ncbi:MAG: DUF362 domain-containing protein [Bryobacteraceae bacterium]
MPTVSIAHSADKHRSREGVYSLVREALERLGGFGAFVKPGQTVLIKPDQSVPRLAEEGATTDPLLVGALVRLARETGAAKVQVAASSSGFFDSLACMKITGMAAAAEREGAELIDLGSDRVPNREVDLPEAEVLHRARLPIPLLEADATIAVLKAKTDSLDIISGSVEFCGGALNQNWRALQSEDGMLERFADMMEVLRPDLCITDALICGEGDGPHAGFPRWRGAILACADPVAMDVMIAALMGCDWTKLRFAAALEERGLGRREPMVMLGMPLERISFRGWPAHRGFEHLPVNVIAGRGVSEFGTLRHVKSALEVLLRRGELQQVLHTAGTPTIMIGEADDPDFERHLQEGPYVVFDDAARPEYKDDPRIFFVSGHPVLRGATRELMRILNLEELERKRRMRSRLSPSEID